MTQPDRFIISPTPNGVHLNEMHCVSFHITPELPEMK